jgi:hypothetical protein
MTPQDAYSTLIIGRLSRDYSSAWEKIRHHILWDDYVSPMEKYGLTQQDAERLRRAAIVKSKIRPTYTKGIRTYESIFELLLFEEGTLLWGGWQKLDNAFRGHLDANWILSPNLARAAHDAERHTEQTLQMARLLLTDESAIRLLPSVKILGVLQHYGFLTPLLDFSTDIRVAAAFACRGYEPGLAGSLGCIIKVHDVDFRAFAKLEGTALGQRVSFKVDEVARIRNQKGVFFADFKVGFLETFTSVERCYFKHGPDSALFGQTAGLTEQDLFPPDDPVAHYVEVCRPSLKRDANVPLAGQQETVFSELAAILRRGHRASTTPSEITDYLLLAKSWTDWDNLSEHQKNEISIFARWFGRLKDTPRLELPPTCVTLMRLKHAVESIVTFDDRAEDATDIFDRLEGANKAITAAVLKDLLREVRAEFLSSGSGFRVNVPGEPQVLTGSVPFSAFPFDIILNLRISEDGRPDTMRANRWDVGFSKSCHEMTKLLRATPESEQGRGSFKVVQFGGDAAKTKVLQRQLDRLEIGFSRIVAAMGKEGWSDDEIGITIRAVVALHVCQILDDDKSRESSGDPLTEHVTRALAYVWNRPEADFHLFEFSSAQEGKYFRALLPWADIRNKVLNAFVDISLASSPLVQAKLSRDEALKLANEYHVLPVQVWSVTLLDRFSEVLSEEEAAELWLKFILPSGLACYPIDDVLFSPRTVERWCPT